MKKTLSIICTTVVLLSLAGCGKKNSLSGNGNSQIGTNISESASVNDESSVSDSENSVPALPDIPRQKISELRGDLEEQLNTVKATEYKNLHLADDFVVKVPDTDALYDLKLTRPALDFESAYELFDKTFDKEFGNIYTQEDKEKLYHVMVYETDLGDFYSDDTLLVKHIDKLKSGEYTFADLYVNTDKAYLTVKPGVGGVHGVNHDGTVKRAKGEDYKPTMVALSFGTSYFDVVKNYLNVDSEDRFEILDGELSVKEAAEMAKKTASENGYGWGGALDPDVYQIKVLDIGEGKYGFSFTMTPSYKGVLFDTYESDTDSGMRTRKEKFDHAYELLTPRVFMMENGKIDAFCGAAPAYTVAEEAAYDSVISFEDVIRRLSEKFGAGMELSLSRAELIYTGMYGCANEDGNSVKKAFPVWKFRCHNLTDDFKYIIYINAVNGNIEYYITEWWEV